MPTYKKFQKGGLWNTRTTAESHARSHRMVGDKTRIVKVGNKYRVDWAKREYKYGE